MRSFEYVVTNPVGIHARPAGSLVKFAQRFSSSITVTNQKNGKSADAKKLFALLSIAVQCQDKVTVTIQGEDEDAALDELQEHFALEL